MFTTAMEHGELQALYLAIVYEAYTEDTNSTTLEHAKELIDYIDNWDFENLKVKDSNNSTNIFGF